MFKQMKLATKMAMGFGALVVVTAILGLVTWRGLEQVKHSTTVSEDANAVLVTVTDCGNLRRDFMIQGFEKAAGQEKNASEKWLDTYNGLISQLKDLEGGSGLQESDRILVRKTGEAAVPYRADFESLTKSRQMRDDAFAAWGSEGAQITKEVQTLIETVIAPALTQAQQTQNLEDVVRWSAFADTLHSQVIEPFLLLRVNAVYLVATNQDKQWEAYSAQIETLKAGLASWTSSVQGETELEAVATRLQGSFAEYEKAGKQYYQGILDSRTATDKMAVSAKAIVDTMNQLNQSLTEQRDSIAARTTMLGVAMTLGAVVLGVVLAVFITRSIVKPINRIIAGLNEGASQVNEAARQVSASSQQLAAGASEQASSLEETSSALEEMAAMTRTNAENARQANGLSDQAAKAAKDGDQTMATLNQVMQGINESSDKVSKIIKVIEEISFQTNLLALNAAVEAARAGEHGKGFAVVADEVRNLAQRAADAARETTSLIEESVNRSREGTQVADDVTKALGGIVADVTKVSELISNITQASQEQAQGVDQVNTAVSQMDQVTQQNAA
ncbi:MAG: methyl-accepting chemotaxis protein, partial [Phycisphaerae bacterium]|nr:methyl-accepting chemotaxis protein [Phycisphaerae bacterium]